MITDAAVRGDADCVRLILDVNRSFDQYPEIKDNVRAIYYSAYIFRSSCIIILAKHGEFKINYKIKYIH